MDPNGNHIGFIAEEDTGIGKILARQWFKTHRAFTTHVFDKHQNEVLTVCICQRFSFPLEFAGSNIVSSVGHFHGLIPEFEF